MQTVHDFISFIGIIYLSKLVYKVEAYRVFVYLILFYVEMCWLTSNRKWMHAKLLNKNQWKRIFYEKNWHESQELNFLIQIHYKCIRNLFFSNSIYAWILWYYIFLVFFHLLLLLSAYPFLGLIFSPILLFRFNMNSIYDW